MNILIYIFIFLLCIVLYIHIIYHLQTSSDDNVYEIDYTNKQNLEKVCNLRQPFSFKFPHKNNLSRENILSKNEQINIIKTEEHNNNTKEDNNDTKEDNNDTKEDNNDTKEDNNDTKEDNNDTKEDNNDTKEDNNDTKEGNNDTKIYSEYNNKLITNTDIIKEIQMYDNFICPEYTVKNTYDIILSDENFKTPMISNYNFRNYYIINEGTIKIRFVSPLYNEFITFDKDYELLQNVATINIWDETNPNIKFTEITFNKGDIIYIPPQWWFSICIVEPAIVSKYNYRSIMNITTYLSYYVYSFISITKSYDENIKENTLKLKSN